MDLDLQLFDISAKDLLKDTLKSRISNNMTRKDGCITECKDENQIPQSDDNEVIDIETTREEKRMRNRLAARKCREKRKQRIMYLEKVCNSLENRMVCLQNEVSNLLKERDTLSHLLSNHWCINKSSNEVQGSYNFLQTF